MHDIFIGIILFILAWILERGSSYGSNREGFFDRVLERWRTSPLNKWHGNYKEELKTLSTTGFKSIKMRGTRPVQHSNLKASRGYDKIMEILMATKMKLEGRVLSLCCGAGGWEQAIAPNPSISRITSVTFGAGPGHQGHKNFTKKIFPGHHKIKLTYADARTYPITAHDVLLFDGGESRNTSEEEARLFKQLFCQSVMRQINSSTKHFILKILIPTDPEMIECMKTIQAITGKGCLMRSSHSRASTLECYFVSMPIMKVEDCVKFCLKEAMERGAADIKLRSVKYGPDYEFYRSDIDTETLPPLDMSKSEEQCGSKLPAEARPYTHWEAKGVYGFGTKGSGGMKYNNLAMNVLRLLIPTLPSFDKWRVTNTTPKCFLDMFRNKIDNPPTENHEYTKHLGEAYEAMADYFLKRGFKYKELSEQEIISNANKQGAPGFQDTNHKNIGDFLGDKNWRKIMKEHETALLNGKPIGGIFNTIAKREKKKMKAEAIGSRMVAYLPIPMRLLELKAFGCILNLTKKEWNRFGVGGLGLHDLGMRIHENWQKYKNPGACSSDIASFDTRIGSAIQYMECKFIEKLGGGKLVRRFYQLYSNPWITIPITGEHTRSELLAGRGQRMSGTQVTYAMNTMTRIVIMILQAAISKDRLEDISTFTREMMEGKHFSGSISGDDEVTIGEQEDIKKLNKSAWILHAVGFPRKDMSELDEINICYNMEEIDFCSHHYMRVTYFDEDTGITVARWAPTRDMTEIIAKATIRLGSGDEFSDEAWLSAQGNNLLVNYHHLRTARAAGLAFKAIVNPRVLLTDKGGFLKPTPWMRQGEILDVVNTVLFGKSTQYPVPNFKVRKFQHIGYAKPRDEKIFDPDFHISQRRKWRDTLHMEAERVVNVHQTGGDTSILNEWRMKELY